MSDHYRPGPPRPWQEGLWAAQPWDGIDTADQACTWERYWLEHLEDEKADRRFRAWERFQAGSPRCSAKDPSLWRRCEKAEGHEGRHQAHGGEGYETVVVVWYGEGAR